MANIKININKSNSNIQARTDNVDITEEMNEKITALCKELLNDSDRFEKDKAFKLIYSYIKKYKRILYAPISNTIYACYNDHDFEEAQNLMGTMNTNIMAVVNYSQGNDISQRISTAQGEKKKHLEDTQKAILKIWDHINLAQTQYSSLKQSDEEYKEKFNKQITPIKDSISKDLNAQLITMVGIFTALAFLIFGGISSLDNILSNTELPLLKVMVIGCVWGICILNLVFVFLFCVGKMTKLNFKSNDNRDASIFQKYPIVWWCNYVIISIMAVCIWGYYIASREMYKWMEILFVNNSAITTIVGTAIILTIVILLGKMLIKRTKHTSGNED